VRPAKGRGKELRSAKEKGQRDMKATKCKANHITLESVWSIKAGKGMGIGRTVAKRTTCGRNDWSEEASKNKEKGRVKKGSRRDKIDSKGKRHCLL